MLCDCYSHKAEVHVLLRWNKVKVNQYQSEVEAVKMFSVFTAADAQKGQIPEGAKV